MFGPNSKSCHADFGAECWMQPDPVSRYEEVEENLDEISQQILQRTKSCSPDPPFLRFIQAPCAIVYPRRP